MSRRASKLRAPRSTAARRYPSSEAARDQDDLVLFTEAAANLFAALTSASVRNREGFRMPPARGPRHARQPKSPTPLPIQAGSSVRERPSRTEPRLKSP